MGYDGHFTGCACRRCGLHRQARRQAAQRRRDGLRAGTWRPWADALDVERVRAHVADLAGHGCAHKWIAAAAGVNPRLVDDLLLGRCERMFAATATALLGVTRYHVERMTANAGERALVDATGTRRRLQALAVLGYRISDIAIEAGISPDMSGVLRGQRVRVTGRLARAVTDIYNTLWATPGPSKRTSRRAIRNGWVPPLAWDDDTIDDPAASPRPWSRSLRRDGRALAEDAAELVSSQGYSREQAAARLGASPRHLERAWSQHGDHGVRLRPDRS